MKTNQPGKQNVLLLYVDKIVFGVLILAAVYYIYSATSLPSIGWTPEQLNNDSTRAKQTIENSTHLEDGLEPVFYHELARDIRSGFKYRYYETPGKWEAAVFPEKIKRGIPQIDSVIKLRAVAFVGPVQVKDRETVFSGNAPTTGMSSDMGAFGDVSGLGGMGGVGGSQAGAKTEPKHWVLLTGLIPYETQLREYVAKFANAMHSSADDFPDYLIFDVQRNEIGVNNPDGTPAWESLKVLEDFAMNMQNWAGFGMDPVDLQYTLPRSLRHINSIPTTSPLPPLANRIYGREVAYPPYIPLMSDSLREQMTRQLMGIDMMMKSWRPPTDKDFMQEENFWMTPTSMGGAGGGGYGGMDGGLGTGGFGGGGRGTAITGMYNPGGGAGGMGSPGGMGMGSPGGMGMGTSGGMGMGSPGGMGMGASGGMGMGSPGGMGMGTSGGMGGVGGIDLNNPWRVYTQYSPTVMVEAKYRLFRYFDFTVKEGKSYQYRVRLAVYNPNFRMNELYLEDEAVKTKLDPIIWSDYSYPTGPAAVNSNARVLAKSVGNTPSRAWQPQTITVSSIVFDETDNEDYIVKDKTGITSGMVLNFPRQVSQKVSELTSTAATSDMGMGMGISATPGRTTTAPKITTKSLEHISGACVLDVVGKRRLIGSNNEHTPPGQVLFMAFDGTIEFQSIKSNKLELDRYEKPATTTMGGAMGGP